MAKKRKKEFRVATVDEVGILMRDIKGMGLWLAFVVVVGVALGILSKSIL
ncbi:hypothetical protein SAMN04487866_11719 [Thermoactinomyces sp. DSM 45891]|nr:hypothetical protein [Thermoactinomyces sp. DSM 45891]SFX67758.1 hypothetical protein SAMN04487866_11719 [Thermoactinomyces sp. DSM 45891]